MRSAADFITIDEDALEDEVGEARSEAEDLYDSIVELDNQRRAKIDELRDLVEEAESLIEEVNDVEGSFNIRNAEIDVADMRQWLDNVEY